MPLNIDYQNMKSSAERQYGQWRSQMGALIPYEELYHTET